LIEKIASHAKIIKSTIGISKVEGIKAPSINLNFVGIKTNII
jgi:hypothetical protein